MLIITTEGKTLVERSYSVDSAYEPDLSLYGGFVAAIAKLGEDVAQDKVRVIQLGTAQFVVMRSNGLLFTLHVGFEVSHFTAMAKLNRIRDVLLAKYGPSLAESLRDSPHLPSLIAEIDAIIVEQTAIDLEQILDYFLTGEHIVGGELLNTQTGETLFSHNREGIEDIVKMNSTLFQIFMELIETQCSLPSVSTESKKKKNLIFKIGGHWLCGIQEEELLLVSIFKKNVDQDVLLDIVYGKLGQILTFVAQYFKEIA